MHVVKKGVVWPDRPAFPESMSSNPSPPKPVDRRISRRNPVDSLKVSMGIFLTIAVVATLYLAREVLTPLAMAFLVAFLLAPLVGLLARRIGKVAAVVVTMAGLMALLAGGGWLISNQVIDLASKLPDYKNNLSAKIESLRPNDTRKFDRLKQTFEDLKAQLWGSTDGKAGAMPREAPEEKAVPVVVVPENEQLSLVSSILGPLAGPLGTASLVLLLATFMLVSLEDLESRFVKLVGGARISSTSQAIDDAGKRIRKYLFMQLVVNASYGAVLAIGLYFIGIPNAVIWGLIATFMRFIPYVGPWIAAAFPILLSLAISEGWKEPILTLSLIVFIELLSNNVMEPLLYGSSTGVSSFALIVAAVFWTWLWGPIGLVLSTPLTVVLAVMGRHVPQLSFLSVMLSEEEALTPADDVYFRLLKTGGNDEVEILDEFLESHTTLTMFDRILMPIVTRLEKDQELGGVTPEQKKKAFADLRETIGEIDFPEPAASSDDNQEPLSIWCLPVRSERDGIASLFLATALTHSGYAARNSNTRTEALSLLSSIEEAPPDFVILSASYPIRLSHAKSLLQKIKDIVPDQIVVLALWGHEGDFSAAQKDSLEAGFESVVTTVAECAAFSEGYAANSIGDFKPAPVPAGEAERLETVRRLAIRSEPHQPELDRQMEALAGDFGMPIAFLSVIGEDTQEILGATGLPADLNESRETGRAESICGHVVADRGMYVIPDILKDKRFAANPLFRANGWRFYAGTPVIAGDGQVIGSLCVMDTKPGKFTQAQRNKLKRAAEALSKSAARVLSEEESRPG